MTPLAAALATALATALAAPGECGLPALAALRPFQPGEVLQFDVDVMGVVKAGTLQLSVERPILGGTQLPLRARVRNTSVFAKVRRLKAAGFSWVDATTLRPQRFRDEMEEDGLRKSTDVRLDRPGPNLAMAWTRGDQRGRTEMARGHAVVLDLISALYYLRAAELRPGAAFCFDLFGNWRLWRLTGSVASRSEVVEAPAGSFEVLRLDARLVRADDPSRTRPLHLWISTDARRLLVAAVSEVDLGPVRAMLARATE
jgi:hypothetical protein